MTQTATFQELLGRFPAFRDLGDERLAWLAQRSRPFVCPVGQELLVQDRMPDHCFCVVEGRGRLLHDDPGLRRPVTLALSKPGDLVGWAGLVRRSPCEWVTASTPLKLIGFSDETFYELEQESEAFSRWLDANDSPAELITALAPALRRRPKAEPPEREVLRHLLPGLRVIAAHSLRRLPDDGAVWLWDSQPSDEPVSIGAEVDPERLAAIPAGEPLRLLRIERDLWSRELNPDLQPPDQLEVPTSVDLWSQDRYSDLSVPDPQGERHPTELSKAAQATESTPRFRGRSIPVVTGIGGQQQAMACLEMLARFYNAPFRRDVMERSVRQSLGDRAVSLEMLGNFAVSMGFTGSLADIPEAQLLRLQFPCFAIVEGQPAMLHDITRGQVKAVLPEYGMVQLSLDDLMQGQGGGPAC